MYVIIKVLVPNKLICGKHILINVCDNQSPSTKLSHDLSKRVIHLESVIMSFWITWRKEYLANLRECHQRRHESKKFN